MTDQEDQIARTKNELIEVMEREVKILQELLSSMHEEQQALLRNDTARVRSLSQSREQVVESLTKQRDCRLSLVDQIHAILTKDCTEEACEEIDKLDILSQFACSKSMEVLSLRDQILALIDELQAQTSRNNYLLESRVLMTRELLDRINPAPKGSTYGGDGQMKKKGVKTKVSIINQEV